MALAVVFYTFSKRDNSTARPSGGTSYNCTLKDDCGVINPRIELNLDMSSNPRGWNYCYIAAFDRYYYVREWTYSNRLWIADLLEDYLASWKDTIGASEQYVLRAASRWDSEVGDSLYPALATTYRRNSRHTLSNWILSANVAAGSFVIGVINGDSSVVGGTAYYSMTPSQMASLREFMLSGVDSWGDITTISGDIAKAFMDPFQYITSCTWWPFSSIGGGTATNIKFGYWESTVQGRPISANSLFAIETFNMAVPPRHDTSPPGNWTQHAPYASYKLNIFPFGIIDLNDNMFDVDNGVSCYILYDYVSGEGTLSVYNAQTFADYGNSAPPIAQVTAQVGINVALSNMSIDVSSLTSPSGLIQTGLSTLVGGVSELFSGGNIASGLASGMTTVSSTGTNGGFPTSYLGGYCSLVATYATFPEENNTEQGRPLCKTVQLSSLSGFIKCAHGDVKLTGTYEEMQMVKSYLERGFFYE